MKGKMKKIIAGIATLAMAAQFAFVIPASAAPTADELAALTLGTGTEAEPYVSYDFTGDSVANKVWGYTSTNGGNVTDVDSDDNWVTYYVGSGNRYSGGIAVKNDNTHGNYAAVSANTGFGDADSDNMRAPSIKINKVPALSVLNSDNTEEMVYKFDFTTDNVAGAIYLNDDNDKPAGDFIKIPMTGLPTATWLTAVITIDTSSKFCAAEIFNGATSVGVVTNTYTTAGNPQRLRFLGGTYNYNIDNIKIYKQAKPVKYTITYSIQGTETKAILNGGDKITTVPDTDKTGYIFKGWNKDSDTATLYSTDQIKALDIAADTTFTAVYDDDPNYVHKIKSVVVTSTKTDAIKQPAEGQTDTYTYTAKVTGMLGEDLTEDCTFVWTAVGNEADDSYTKLAKSTTKESEAVFSIINGVSNYYGYIKAVATLNPANKTSNEDITTGEATMPYAILGESESSNIVPEAGYPINMNSYSDTIVGYVATSDALTSKDLLLNNWSIYGSNKNRDLVLVQDSDGTKSLEFRSSGGNRGGNGSSTVGVYQWTAQTKQYTIDTTIKLPSGASMGIWNNTPNNTGAASECRIDMTGEGIKISGGDAVAGTSDASKWYRIVMACDPTNKKSYADIYGEDGNLIGTSAVAVSEGTGMKYICLSGSFPINLQSFRVYTNTPAKMTITGSDAVTVPEEGTETATYTESCLDKDGIKILTDPVWSLDEDYGDAVEINDKTGELTIKPGASGTVVIKATVGSIIAEKEVTLSTSGNVINMKGTSSLTIPFEGESAVTGTYSAVTLDKEGQTVEGDTIAYSFLDKDNQPLTNLPNGVTFDSAKGVLTVSAGAKPAVIYLKATNTEGLSNKIKINIHGMSFGFGTDEPEEGYTQVTSASQYTDKIGFGFEDVSSLTDAAKNVAGSADYKFKAKVPNGNYTVTVATTSTSMKSEVIDGIDAATGITKSGTTFDVAVCDDVLDLTFAANSNVSSISIAQKTKGTKAAKPAIYAIGDSTTKNGNNGVSSWGEVASQYVNNDVFSSFANHGKAGDDSVVYYNSGRVENVLLSVNEGDYVTINMGINSKTAGEGTSYDTLMRNYYIAGVIQRGAIPVILTHTPQGPVGSYTGNYSNGKFHTARTGQHNNDLRQYAVDYDLNLVDVSNFADEYFNSLTEADVANTELYGTRQNFSTDNPPTTVLELVQSWFNDHNHYDRPLSDKIAKYVLDSLEDIVKNPFAIASVTQTAAADEDDVAVSLTATLKEGASAGSATYDAYIAQYDANGALVDVVKTTVTFSTSGLTQTVKYTPANGAASAKVFVWDQTTGAPLLTNTAISVATGD